VRRDLENYADKYAFILEALSISHQELVKKIEREESRAGY
jgi:hypothetical protein